MPGTPPHLPRRSGIHIPLVGNPEVSRQTAVRLDATDLLYRDLAELQGLHDNGLFMMAEATTQRNGGSHEHGGGDNALQTLHGLLSFG